MHVATFLHGNAVEILPPNDNFCCLVVGRQRK